MKTERIAEITDARRGGTRRLLHGLWSVLVAALPVMASAAEPLWDDDDYLVSHQAAIKVYDHDFTFKQLVHNNYTDTHSFNWTPEGWLRTANEAANVMVDIGPDSPDPILAYPYRRLTLRGSSNGNSGDIQIAPDGAMFWGMAQPYVVKKYTIGPDGTDNTAGAEVAAEAWEVGSWGINNIHYGVAVVPDVQYGYVVWVGAELDYIRILTPDLNEIPYDEGGVVFEGDAQTTVSMHYDPATRTVLAGRETAPSPSGTLVAVELDVTTRTIVRRFYLPSTPGFLHLINGITRGANGIVVAADSGTARIHVWNADGTYVRSVTMPDNTGFNYAGERASGSIVWAGNRPKPAPNNTAPSFYCPDAQVISCTPPTGTTANLSVVVQDPDISQTLSVTLRRNGQEIATQSVPASASGTDVLFSFALPPGNHQIDIEVSDGEASSFCDTAIFVLVDTLAPTVVSAPGDVTLECPATPVFGAPQFSDACDADLTITSTDEALPVSGKELNKTRRTWTATDGAGNSISLSQTVTVVDTAAPVFGAIPADVSVAASNVNGAIVNYSPASASDSCSPAVVSYSQTSGMLFPVGTTTVILTATDMVGNQATASFTVTVTAPSASAQLDTLIETVKALPVKKTIKTVLLLELTMAQAALNRDQPQAAVTALRTFEETVEALRKTKRLTADQARQLTDASQAIRAALSGS
ncbi:MAG: HYR domain-containing protein [Verrucomicrobiales bacterium]|nr:HYR domain-containing protein [Verrucomicrobiales bacterium]